MRMRMRVCVHARTRSGGSSGEGPGSGCWEDPRFSLSTRILLVTTECHDQTLTQNLQALQQVGCRWAGQPQSGSVLQAPDQQQAEGERPAPHSPHSSPSCAISMRAKAKASSSLLLNHLSTTCGGPRAGGQAGQCRVLGSGRVAGVGTTAQVAASQRTSVQEAVTLQGCGPAPRLGSGTHLQT